jgi:hypothetical protein
MRQLSVKKNSGASSVRTKFFKNGMTPMIIAKSCAQCKKRIKIPNAEIMS